MRLDGFNLNLPVALDALLTATTMTEAADRLSLTRPALSAALKQSRDRYDDPLILYAPPGPSLTRSPASSRRLSATCWPPSAARPGSPRRSSPRPGPAICGSCHLSVAS